MNYWKQFAEMLGLKLGQEFVLTDSYGKRKDGYTYQITKNGFLYKSQINDDWYGEKSETIERLLEGYDKAVPKPWKPKEGEQYWYYSETFKHAVSCAWRNSLCDLLYWKSGNFFKTKEEANEKGCAFWKELKKEYEEA